MAEAVGRLYDLPPDDPVLAAIPVEPRATPRARRSRRAARVRAGAPAAQGAARHRAGDRRRPRDDRGILACRGGPERLRQLLPGPAGFGTRRWLNHGGARSRVRRQGDRRTHGDQPEQGGAHRAPAQRGARRRLRTAASIPGTQVEIQNYIDDTGVQVADVAVGFRELEHKTLDEVRAIADAARFDLLLLGPLRAGHRVVRRRSGTAEDPREGAARHRARQQRDRRAGRLHRRSHRPRPSARRCGG